DGLVAEEAQEVVDPLLRARLPLRSTRRRLERRPAVVPALLELQVRGGTGELALHEEDLVLPGQRDEVDVPGGPVVVLPAHAGAAVPGGELLLQPGHERVLRLTRAVGIQGEVGVAGGERPRERRERRALPLVDADAHAPEVSGVASEVAAGLLEDAR